MGPLRCYRLGYPNQEVESASNEALLGAWLPSASVAAQLRLSLYHALHALDWPALRAHFESLFASIPADWYRANPRPIWLLGVAFSSTARHVVGWDVQPASLDLRP